MFRPIETVVIPTEQGTGTATTQNPPTAIQPLQMTPVKTYTAEAGDTLGKMASKAMGANTLANRQAMMKANPELQKNPDRVVIGEKYVVPGAAGAPTPVVTPTPVVVERPETVTNTVPPAANGVATVEYVAKSGDYISKIAKEQCGTASNAMVQQIIQMNK